MPPNGTLRSFINALTSGQTNITRCLERLANDPARRQKYAADINAPHAAVGQLPGWLRNEMVQAGMSQPEVDHVERWPDAEKEKVRRQIVEAIRDGNTTSSTSAGSSTTAISRSARCAATRTRTSASSSAARARA